MESLCIEPDSQWVEWLLQRSSMRGANYSISSSLINQKKQPFFDRLQWMKGWMKEWIKGGEKFAPLTLIKWKYFITYWKWFASFARRSWSDLTTIERVQEICFGLFEYRWKWGLIGRFFHSVNHQRYWPKRQWGVCPEVCIQSRWLCAVDDRQS